MSPVRRFILVLLGAVIAVLTLSVLPAAAAHADGAYTLSGNVKYESTGVANVTVTATQDGVSVSAQTNDRGHFEITLNTGGSWKVQIDKSTLPSDISVSADDLVKTADFQGSTSVATNFFLGETAQVSVNIWDQVLQRAFNGLNFGLLLALAAIGVSLIFGTTGLSNFAHGEMITFGALISFTLANVLGWPIALALFVALVLSAGLGWTLDASIWRPLRKRGVGVVQLMIVSIGLSLTMRYTLQYFYGGSTLQLPGAANATVVILGPVRTTWIALISMAISVIMLLAVAYFLVRTRIGKATRAVSDNPALASVSGIDVNAVIRIVWVISGLMAGLAGILWAYYRPGASWDMGFQILLLVFAATTLGGLGTAFGALAGSLIVGMFTELSTLILPSDMKYVGALIVLILVLLIRPQGILGRKERVG